MPPRMMLAGDSTLIVELEERIDPAVNARAIRLADAIRRAAIGGVRDVAPTYRSVAVSFDPLRTKYDELVEWLLCEADAAEDRPVELRGPIDVPVCYGGELGPDLDDVAAFAKMPTDEVIALHSSTTYRVFMLGFLPGFAYMGTVDARIAAPRRASPRVRVPRGSVGIAGGQTGIYPRDTPGGWQVIGRTGLELFDVNRPSPALLAAGDAVRFVSVDRARFDRLLQPQAAADNGWMQSLPSSQRAQRIRER